MKIEKMHPVVMLFAGLAACAVFAACGGDDSSSPRDRLIDIGTHSLEMRIEGAGFPVVVIDAGISDTLDKLKPLQDRLARATRVVTYNRAGYGRSEPGPLPRDVGREAEELKTLLGKASVPGPYVLVGHSLGALNMQVFASKSPAEVASMVLLDPPPLSFLLGRDYAELGAMAEKMTAEWQAVADSGAKSADRMDREKAAFFRMIASEHREMFGESARLVEAITSFGNTPLVVLAAGKSNPAFGDVAEEYQKYWIGQSRILADRSSNGAFVLAEGSSHYLYLDVLELVEKEILAVIDEARRRGGKTAVAEIKTIELNRDLGEDRFRIQN